MTNEKVRITMMRYGFPQWKLAKLLNCGENTIWRMLRSELSEEKQSELCEMIEIAAKSETEGIK